MSYWHSLLCALLYNDHCVVTDAQEPAEEDERMDDGSSDSAVAGSHSPNVSTCTRQIYICKKKEENEWYINS